MRTPPPPAFSLFLALTPVVHQALSQHARSLGSSRLGRALFRSLSRDVICRHYRGWHSLQHVGTCWWQPGSHADEASGAKTPQPSPSATNVQHGRSSAVPRRHKEPAPRPRHLHTGPFLITLRPTALQRCGATVHGAHPGYDKHTEQSHLDLIVGRAGPCVGC